jgi:hypothetical protein
MGKRVRLMAGVAGMAPALGMAVAAPAAAAPAAGAAHSSGKTVFLQASQAAGGTACTGTARKTASATSTHMNIVVSYQGSCVLGVTGYSRSSMGQLGAMSGDQMRTRVREHGTRVFSGQATFTYAHGSTSAYQPVGVIGHRVCAAAFSRLHPTEKIAGTLCVSI